MASLIGQRLGQYEILSLLGEGGMAAVYRARQLNIRREVAIKVIKPGLLDSEKMSEFVQRFEREGETIATLDHPHILKLFDYGQHEGMLYLVMPLLSGGSLTKLMQQGPLPLEQASRLLEQVASALDYAHHHGVIHRDLKPANILLDSSGHAILTDFGIAKMVEQSTLTQSGLVMGTPAYMSPEQWRAWQLDGRSDVYSLGVIAYEMLTGKMPFVADTPSSLMYLHLQEPPPAPRSFRPSLTPAIEKVVLKALAKNRDERFESAGEMAAALARAIAGGQPPAAAPLTNEDQGKTEALPAAPTSLEPSARPGLLLAPAVASEDTVPLPAPRVGSRSGARRGGLLAIGALALLAVVGIVALLASLAEPPEATLPTATGAGVALVRDRDTAGSATATGTPTATASYTHTAPAPAVAVLASATLTASHTASPTATDTPTATYTPTANQTSAATPTPSLSPTELPATVDIHAAALATMNVHATQTATGWTATPTVDVMATINAELTVIMVETLTTGETATAFVVSSFTWTPTATPSPTETATRTATGTPSLTATATQTSTPTATSTASVTPSLTATPTFTWTASPTQTPTRTPSPSPTPLPTRTATRTTVRATSVASAPARVTVNVVMANLRAGPGTGYAIVDSASDGDVFPVVARVGEGEAAWYLVALTPEQDAWIFSGIVTLEPGSAIIEVAATVPPAPTGAVVSAPAGSAPSSGAAAGGAVTAIQNGFYAVTATIVASDCPGWGYPIGRVDTFEMAFIADINLSYIQVDNPMAAIGRNYRADRRGQAVQFIYQRGLTWGAYTETYTFTSPSTFVADTIVEDPTRGCIVVQYRYEGTWTRP